MKLNKQKIDDNGETTGRGRNRRTHPPRRARQVGSALLEQVKGGDGVPMDSFSLNW